jgi:hypothetical protein
MYLGKFRRDRVLPSRPMAGDIPDPDELRKRLEERRAELERLGEDLDRMKREHETTSRALRSRRPNDQADGEPTKPKL